MKKLVLVILTLFCFCSIQVKANEFNKYSNDTKIISALELLNEINSRDVIERLDNNFSKIIFYDLSLIDFSYANHYAISSIDENGENYILINEKFKIAPKETIACLIAHESVHILPKATLQEEVKATTLEAQIWLKVRNNVTRGHKNDLIIRENHLANLYQNSTAKNNLIQNEILSNSFYQNQLAMKE